MSLQSYCEKYHKEHLLSQWHPSKNGGLTPADVAQSSRIVVWWRCEKGHEWQTQVASRISGTGCPRCYAQKLAAKRQQKAKGAVQPPRRKEKTDK